jgi:hypoxanthine phosphoribosyltransferase
METSIRLHDLTFTPYIDRSVIADKVVEIAQYINHDYTARKPLFLVIMNGAFMFAADLLRHVSLECDIAFIHVKSYVGQHSSGTVEIDMPSTIEIVGRDLILVEDIIDTGTTMAQLLPILRDRNPRSIALTAIFIKEGTDLHNIQVSYPGLTIPNRFIIGYGLDYNGLGRNLADIYQVVGFEIEH